MIGKVARKISAAIGIRHLAIAAKVHPAKNYAPARVIDEPSPFDV
jgi:hypothetical protein